MITPWIKWLAKLREQGFASAGDLVDAIGKAGIPDGPAIAERLLREAEENKQIVRGDNPDTSNRYVRELIHFGVGGLSGGKATLASRSPLLYGWSLGPSH